MPHRIITPRHTPEKPIDAPLNAMGETDYRRFEPTDKVIHSISMFDPWDVKYNVTAEIIAKHSPPYSSDSSDDRALITEFFSSLGFRRLLGNIKQGTHALIFEGNDGQMFRLVDNTHWDSRRIVHPMILQPLIPFQQFGRYAIEVLPKVHTLKEVLANPNLAAGYGKNWLKTAREKLLRDAKECGLSLCDIEDKNLAVIRSINGTPLLLVLDPGSAFWHSHELPKESPAITAYYEAAQQAHLKSLGLKKGELKGVLGGDALERRLKEFADQRKHKDATQAVYPQALKAGVSPGEFGAAARSSVKGDPEKGFCERIRQELSERHNIPLHRGNS